MRMRDAEQMACTRQPDTQHSAPKNNRPKLFLRSDLCAATVVRRRLGVWQSEFIDYYNHRRSHMERDWSPPIREEPDEVEALKLDQIEVKSYVGGLIKSFERKAV